MNRICKIVLGKCRNVSVNIFVLSLLSIKFIYLRKMRRCSSKDMQLPHLPRALFCAARNGLKIYLVIRMIELPIKGKPTKSAHFIDLTPTTVNHHATPLKSQ